MNEVYIHKAIIGHLEDQWMESKYLPFIDKAVNLTTVHILHQYICKHDISGAWKYEIQKM